WMARDKQKADAAATKLEHRGQFKSGIESAPTRLRESAALQKLSHYQKHAPIASTSLLVSFPQAPSLDLDSHARFLRRSSRSTAKSLEGFGCNVCRLGFDEG